MVTVYQLIFFFSIGLIAIVVTLFVLAVSLLGRAIALSTQEQIRTEEKRREDTENETRKIQEKLEQVKHSGQLNVEDLYRDLKDLASKIKKHNRKLRWIRLKPKFLTASWGVLVPGAFFLISAIISILALYRGGSNPATAPYMWISITTLGIGICFICLTLKVVEGVAKTSEETAFQRETEVLKTSLREFEEERKPILEISFEDEQPPFHVKPESDMSLMFRITLQQGFVGRNVVAYFFAPPEFVFVDSPRGPQLTGKLAKYVSTQFELGEMRRPVMLRRVLKLKVPSEPDKYPLLCRLVCEGFYSDVQKFEIVVK